MELLVSAFAWKASFCISAITVSEILFEKLQEFPSLILFKAFFSEHTPDEQKENTGKEEGGKKAGNTWTREEGKQKGERWK